MEVPRELFDPAYEFDNTELWPDIGEVLGFDAAQEAMREYWETFEAYHVEIEEVIYADEGRVVNVVRDGGRMRGTDAEVWNRFFHVWTFRNGSIVRLSIHTDRKRSLEAAGLRVAQSLPGVYRSSAGGGRLTLPLRQRDEQTGAGHGEVGGDDGDRDGDSL